MIFHSKRKFKLWAYTVSHNSLLLRSYLQFPDEEGYSNETSYNIDMEFLFVEYIEVKSALDSISISIMEKEELSVDLKEKFDSFRGKIFEILSGKKKYYIIADSLIIGRNKWVREDRVFNHDLNLHHDEILVSIPH
ncbi:hypothetical protein HNP38_003291 [Chryseobacterium defluvii]|uniref:Uncharacterized protein n=1 Tax=Chryseobacterium defluvii TaxID=160396 RepID=A0A840KEZ6_9FLAO|nr:hypothetical protein [Chryseobacterium defluvii]MBB4807951.1 hypothetical protein [Chryseobacterium defluvii]